MKDDYFRDAGSNDGWAVSEIDVGHCSSAEIRWHARGESLAAL